jgi:hypothetical protein
MLNKKLSKLASVFWLYLLVRRVQEISLETGSWKDLQIECQTLPTQRKDDQHSALFVCHQKQPIIFFIGQLYSTLISYG